MQRPGVREPEREPGTLMQAVEVDSSADHLLLVVMSFDPSNDGTERGGIGVAIRGQSVESEVKKDLTSNLLSSTANYLQDLQEFSACL